MTLATDDYLTYIRSGDLSWFTAHIGATLDALPIGTARQG